MESSVNGIEEKINLQNHKIIELIKNILLNHYLNIQLKSYDKKKSNENSQYSQKIGKSISTLIKEK